MTCKSYLNKSEDEYQLPQTIKKKKKTMCSVKSVSSQTGMLKQKHCVFVPWNTFLGISVVLPAPGIEVSDKASEVCNFLLCKTIKKTVTFSPFNRQTETAYCI